MAREDAGKEGRKTRFFATCPPGFEEALKRELEARHVGARDVVCRNAGVSFSGEDGMQTAYRALLWSRTAVRILSLLYEGPLVVPTRRGSPDAAYSTARRVPWHRYIEPGMSVDVRARVALDAREQGIDSSRFCALRMRDAVCDTLRDETGERPPPPRRGEGADVPLFVAVRYGRAQIYRDLVGDLPLTRRGYKGAVGAVGQHRGTLGEGAAAGALLYAGMQERFADARDADRAVTVADPMCGTGTLAIEAALIACNVAPGLLRVLHAGERFSIARSGSEDAAEAIVSTLPIRNWPDHSQRGFAAAALGAGEAARPAPQCGDVRICCSDADGSALDIARAAASAAGVGDIVDIADAPMRARAWAPSRQADFVAVNPPWGKRVALELDAMAEADDGGDGAVSPVEERAAALAEEAAAWDDLRYFLRDSGAVAPGGDAWILSGDPSLTAALKMKAPERLP